MKKRGSRILHMSKLQEMEYYIVDKYRNINTYMVHSNHYINLPCKHKRTISLYE